MDTGEIVKFNTRAGFIYISIICCAVYCLSASAYGQEADCYELRECITSQTPVLDDRVSDASTIARSIMSVCGKQTAACVQKKQISMIANIRPFLESRGQTPTDALVADVASKIMSDDGAEKIKEKIFSEIITPNVLRSRATSK